MAIEKYLNSSVVFDPIPSYVGLWFFRNENLIKNSKKVEGVNLFQKYYQDYIYNPLKQYFKYLDNLKISIGFTSSANDDLFGRHLSPNKLDFFLGLTRFLNSRLDKYGKTEDEYRAYITTNLASHIKDDNDTLNNAFITALQEKENKLKTLIEDEFNSDFFDVAMQDYEEYKLYTGNQITFSTYIKATYNLTRDLQNGLRTLGDFFDRDLNYQKLYECFDSDTFYLLFAIIIYENCIMLESKEEELDNSYFYLNEYFEAIGKMVKEDGKYNPTVLYAWKNGKKEKISRRELQSRYEELKKRHPEKKPLKLPSLEDSERYKDIILVENLKRLCEGETQINWEFLPEGIQIKKSETLTGKSNNERKNSIDKDKALQDVNMRITILENSGFIGRPIRGLNTFNGYYAFVYPNGVVILEKFWNNEETLSPAMYNATYVMNIDNFIEMSKISKLNLIDYIKAFPEVGVKRIFHTSINNWQRNLYKEINGSYRLEDAIQFISSLKTEVVENEQ